MGNVSASATLYAKFQWVEDVVNFDVSSIASDSPTGYILEVDLEYPQRRHNIHVDLPSARRVPNHLAAAGQITRDGI